jgi:serine protease Do
MSKTMRTLLMMLGAALIFAAGWWLGGQRSGQALTEVSSPVTVQAVTTPEPLTERESLAAKRRLNIASLAALFDVEEPVADALMQEYESVREQYRLMTRDDLAENDPQDVAAFYIRSLGAGAEANPILKEWLAGRPGTFIGESVWGDSAELPRLKGPLPDFLLAGKYGTSGTGFFISPDGWLVTNAHVVGKHPQVDIRGAGGMILTARVVKVDAKADLALLKIDAPPRGYLEICSEERPLGTRVFTIGFPNVDTQGAQAKFTEGSISSLAGWRDDPSDYQISVPLHQGNSGGALVDANTGRMVGVVTSSLSPSRADSVGYAIKAHALAKLLRSTPECASIALPIGAASGSSREESIERAQKASVMVLVK